MKNKFDDVLVGVVVWVIIFAACTGALYHAINILIP